MALVSISKAAKLAGIARSNLYETYINKGVISLSKDEKGRPKIDTAELLRVFGNLNLPPEQDRSGQYLKTDRTVQDTATIDQRQLIELLQQQLEEAKERERFYQQQLSELTQTIRLLEYKPETKVRKWWKFWR